MTETQKEKKGRNRPKNFKRWTVSDETNIIKFLKANREFEKPTARVYYSKFMQEYGLSIYWKLLVYKVRNMRTVYRRAKEYELNKKHSKNINAEEVRNVMLKICWYVDDFDILFPDNMHNNTSKRPSKESSSDDDESSNQGSDFVHENLVTDNSNSQSTEHYLREQAALSCLPKSIERDILAVQTGKFNYKKQKFDDNTMTRQQELELAKEKFSFAREKFHQEIRLKEREIDSRERLKIMELQMNERIAMKKLELKEKLALQSMKKHEYSFTNVYHNMD